MKTLSIIIPTYNMSKFIRQCIESLLINDLDDLDIIVVNDGSTDDSSTIANEYAQMHPNSIRVFDKKNGNYGSCVNFGVKVAEGKYIKILDADDTFDSNVFAVYLQKLKNTDADLVLNDCIVVSPQGKVLKKIWFKNFIKDKKTEIKDCQDVFPYRLIMMHNVAYRTQLIRDCEYFQTEGISYTDDEWIYRPVVYVKIVCYYTLSLYRYLVGRSGQTVDEKNIEKNIYQIAKIAKRMAKEYNECFLSLNSFGRKYLEERFVSKVYFLYNRYIFEGKGLGSFNIKEFDKELKEEAPIAYDFLNRHCVSILGVLSIPYIKIWRERGEKSCLLRFLKMAKAIKRIFK